MVDLHKEFGANPRFHQVSISITPEFDTPDVLNTFMAGQGITPQDPWWFLTGDQTRLRGFMTDQLRFNPCVDNPPDQRQTEFDLVQHDLRIGLIDGEGRLRGFYEVQNPDPPTAAFHLERLRTDIRRLLAE
jgi:cytochrome oxidase Cu insertion factor (SCO1/SenC/PrrC family)